MAKKKFTQCEAQVTTFESQSIITSSGFEGETDDFGTGGTNGTGMTDFTR